MSHVINYGEILVANAMGIMLGAAMLIGNNRLFHTNSIGHKYIREMLWIAMLGCVLDPVVFMCDGRPGLAAHMVVYIGNLLMFIANLLIGPLWVNFTAGYMRGGLSFKHRRALATACGIGVIMLLVNIVKPFVFMVDADNVYSRMWGYLVFVLLEIGFIIDGIIAYSQSKRKIGMLRFFPVWVFLVPIAVGIAVQTMWYGISSIWPCVVIAVTVIVNGMNTEMSYRDKLTGLYNKYYLDLIKEKADRTRNTKAALITAVMADMNSLKSINDTYGHSEGDFALRKLARIINRTVADNGSVVRIAGDEFAIILNTQKEDTVKEILDNIRKDLAEWPNAHDKEYNLSVSMGYEYFNLKEVTVDEMMVTIDEKMYAEKRKFYMEHPSLDRRKR